jgi:uncharacterized protein
MRCPVDKIEMISQEVEGVLIDECPQCKGIWFDQGELEAVKDALEPDTNWMEVDLWRQEDRFDLSQSEGLCPRDNVRLMSLKYGEAAIEIETCLKCHGVWLDGGELKKIISALDAEIDQMSASDYLSESLKEAREVLTGEGSLASEWKDLKTLFRLFQYRTLVENPSLYKALYAIQRTGLGLAGYNPGS